VVFIHEKKLPKKQRRNSTRNAVELEAAQSPLIDTVAVVAKKQAGKGKGKGKAEQQRAPRPDSVASNWSQSHTLAHNASGISVVNPLYSSSESLDTAGVNTTVCPGTDATCLDPGPGSSTGLPTIVQSRGWHKVSRSRLLRAGTVVCTQPKGTAIAYLCLLAGRWGRIPRRGREQRHSRQGRQRHTAQGCRFG